MPIYQCVCNECGGQVEVVQKFIDDALTVNDERGGRLRKVFSPVGIVFKGSGFYRTDSRGSGFSASAFSSGAGGSSSSDSSPSSDSSKSAGDSAKLSFPAGKASPSSGGSSGEKVA